MNNPLLNEWNKVLALPPYKDIEDIHFEDAINTAMSIQNSKIGKISDQSASATFSNTITPLLNSGKKLIEILSIFYSL
ncbi:MAG: peptidase M3, partial [Rhodobacteraceae bacterium]